MLLDVYEAMKISIPILFDRISPVFDEARKVLLIEIAGGKEVSRTEESLPAQGPPWKAMHLIGLGVKVLICSAISWPLERRLLAADIQVIPHTCGPVEDVLQAYLAGRLTDHSFLMPGCRRRRGRCQNRGHANRLIRNRPT